jgi:hypothetical protein
MNLLKTTLQAQGKPGKGENTNRTVQINKAMQEIDDK